MKKRVLILTALITVTCMACFTKGSAKKELLLSGSQISKSQKEILTKAGLNTADSIFLLFSQGNLANNAAFITGQYIAVLDSQKILGAKYPDIFDMLHSHSKDSVKASTITIYLKDDTDFTIRFKGNTSSDEQFFNILRDSWAVAN